MEKMILGGVLLGLACAVPAFADTHYVVKDNAEASSPFTSWTTAASNIQQAIDDTNCVAPDTVLVSNGIYRTGGQASAPDFMLTNRVAVTKAITVRAVSTNWADTVIEGAPDPYTLTNGPAAIRCVYLTNNATLIGFTLTNGYTRGNQGGGGLENYPGMGGGVYCVDIGSVVSNCHIVANRAARGGGFHGGTILNCRIADNVARYTNDASSGAGGGGAFYYGASITIRNCVFINNCSRNSGGFYGAGNVYDSTFIFNRAEGYASSTGGGLGQATLVSNCVVMYNYAYYSGGGVYRSPAVGSLIANNYSIVVGGGFDGWNTCGMINCTVVGNSNYYTSTFPAGIYQSKFTTNCIVYSNYVGSVVSNYNSTCPNMSYCCAWPLTNNVGNIDDAPSFADFAGKDYRLSPNSPCINKGINLGWMNTAVDLDGHRRIIEGTVDIGAYEFLHRGAIIRFR